MKKIYLLAAAVCTLGFASCDIDDVENVGELSTSNFPVSETDGVATIAGVYENLNEVNANPQESFFYLAQLAADDALGGGGSNDKLMQAEDLMLSSGADMTNDFYKQRYEGINRANTLISALPNTKMSDDLKTQLMGEAKFLRAFYYYELSSMYGNVPLRTEPGGETATQGNIEDIWKQILMDLRDAAQTMPAVRRTDGRIDKYQAEGMLARAWLFYTGFFCNGSTIADLTSTNYAPLTSVQLPDETTLTKEDVIKYVDDCVNNSGYALVPDFRNLWAYTNRCTVENWDQTKGLGLKWCQDDEAGKWNSDDVEYMFSIKFNKQAAWSSTSTIGYANGYALHFGVRGNSDDAKRTFPFGQGWGAGPVAPNLLSDWKAAEPNDMRRAWTIKNLADYPNYKWNGDNCMQETALYNMKLGPIVCWNEDSTKIYSSFETLMYGPNDGSWDVSGFDNFQLDHIHDLCLLRFADVLLMQSELKEDVAPLNKVRARAGLPALSSYSLRALQNERRWELAMEGIRWNDIRRWHIAAGVLSRQENQPIKTQGNDDINKPHNGGYAARYNATAGFAKMPETQVAIGAVKQNEGWTGSDSDYGAW